MVAVAGATAVPGQVTYQAVAAAEQLASALWVARSTSWADCPRRPQGNPAWVDKALAAPVLALVAWRKMAARLAADRLLQPRAGRRAAPRSLAQVAAAAAALSPTRTRLG